MAAPASAEVPIKDVPNVQLPVVQKWAMKYAPALVPLALTEVKGKPAGYRSVYLAGAVLGYVDYEFCYAVQFRPSWFKTKAKATFSQHDLAQLSVIGISADSFFPPFDKGVMLGCTFFR